MTSRLDQLRPNRENFSADAAAGFTFAIVNIPQAMANALLANVNPVLGLYTLLIATPVGAIFTSSVYMNVSTTSALSIAAGDALIGVPEPAKEEVEELPLRVRVDAHSVIRYFDYDVMVGLAETHLDSMLLAFRLV